MAARPLGRDLQGRHLDLHYDAGVGHDLHSGYLLSARYVLGGGCASHVADRANLCRWFPHQKRLRHRHFRLKADLRNAMLDDRTDGIDIEDIEYQRVQAKAFDYDLFVVRDTVAKLNLEILTVGKNKKFHFKELTPGDLGKLKVSRSTETNFVQIAGVTKDKIFGSFAGIMQALVEHETCDNVHVIFHFKNYDDIRTLKIPTQEKIEKFKKFVTVPVTYEFVDKEQFVTNNGIDVTMFAARG
jgi:hypothetical protein